MNNDNVFKPHARLLLQLGDQLIRNESIALIELVKNSYDADATSVAIEMEKLDEPGQGSIVIQDDGEGMDADIIRDVWLEPGSDYKEKQYKEKKRTKKYNRLPLGEKGIGRFGVHKLGYEIELTSKKAGQKEVFLKIDWTRFEDAKYLNEVPIDIIVRDEPELFLDGKTGTNILINNLRAPWEKKTLREIYRSLKSLSSPFKTVDSFVVDVKVDKTDWIKDIRSFEDMQDNALFKFQITLEGKQVKKFKYEFVPFPDLGKLAPKTIRQSDDEIKKLKRLVNSDKKEIDLASHKIGTIRFEGLIFDVDRHVLKFSPINSKEFQEYLKHNGGVRVYRDGIRVYDYGEPGNDWLDLGTRRVNLPTKRVSNNLIIAAIHLDRDESSELIEKTNREGFIENGAFAVMKDSILYALNLVEVLRNQDKEKIRESYGPKRSSEPVMTSLQELRASIDKNVSEEPLKKELGKHLKQIERDYKMVTNVLLKSAGTGLTLGVVIHEIEKIIGELRVLLEKEGNKSPRMVMLVEHLATITENYANLLRKQDAKQQSLTRLIEDALFNINFRIETHKVHIEPGYLKAGDSLKIKCNRNFVIGSIINVIDNSLWWLDYRKTKKKQILIDIVDLPDRVAIIIADNGPGFALPTDEIAKPFVSGKPDGMGLGLHIVQELMRLQNGYILFPGNDEFPVLEEFEKGAKTVLVFKKETSGGKGVSTR
jgi:signal transduction histidine kinase